MLHAENPTMRNRAVMSVPRHSSGRLFQSLLPTSHRDSDHLYLISPSCDQCFYLISSPTQVSRSVRRNKRNRSCSFHICNHQIVFLAFCFISTTGRAKPRIRATIMDFFSVDWASTHPGRRCSTAQGRQKDCSC